MLPVVDSYSNVAASTEGLLRGGSGGEGAGGGQGEGRDGWALGIDPRP